MLNILLQEFENQSISVYVKKIALWKSTTFYIFCTISLIIFHSNKFDFEVTNGFQNNTKKNEFEYV